MEAAVRSERDVIATIGAVRPDAVMIELDEERLEFMRGPSRPTLQAGRLPHKRWSLIWVMFEDTWFMMRFRGPLHASQMVSMCMTKPIKLEEI